MGLSHQKVGIVILLKKQSLGLVVQSDGRELSHLYPHLPDPSILLEGTLPLPAGLVEILLDVLLCYLAAHFLGLYWYLAPGAVFTMKTSAFPWNWSSSFST